jgi:abequosyltransferase
MSILLSFCIPTYNRAKFIGQTLESIVSQANFNIEIVIVDGASTDNTSEVVKPFQDKFPNLIYYRSNKNMGVDRDMAKSVELAHGEYCWLMSSDDILAKGAIDIILNKITSRHDIYLCDIFYCDSDLVPWSRSYFLRKSFRNNIFNISNNKEFIDYMNLASSNNALFCYICSIIFLRKKWLNTEFNELMDNSGYAHVFSLFSFRKTDCIINYISIPLVLNRPGNDSFSGNGLEKRYLIDFDGYLLLANLLFSGELEIKQKFLSLMTKEHKWYRLLKLRLAMKSTNNWDELTIKLLQFGYRPSILRICNLVGRFHFIVNIAMFLNVMLKKGRKVFYKLPV